MPNMATKKKLLLSGLPHVSMETLWSQDRKLKLDFKLFMAFLPLPPLAPQFLLYIKYDKENFRVWGTECYYKESHITYLEVVMSAR